MNKAQFDPSEFTDTYSDDISVLLSARAALLSHPLRNDYAVSGIIDAAVCRLFIVTMIGSVEMLLKRWQDNDKRGILKKYFDKNAHNGDRILNMSAAFRNSGFGVDGEVFEDYLAIKYLRNTIVHYTWKEHEKEWVVQRGFPTDTRKLTQEHLIRVENVNQNMMLYAAAAGLFGPQTRFRSEVTRLKEPSPELIDSDGFIRIRDLDQIIWNNIERLATALHRAIEDAAASKSYEKIVRQAMVRAQSLGHHDQSREFFVAIRQAGLERPEMFSRNIEWAKEAFEFWNEYQLRVLLKREIIPDRCRLAQGVFESTDFVPLYQLPFLGHLSRTPQKVSHEVLKKFIHPTSNLVASQVLDTLRLGEAAYSAIPNITPVTLLVRYLPVIDPLNTKQYLSAAEGALEVFKLGRTWYSLVERNCLPEVGIFDSYNRLIAEFLADRPNVN